MVIQIGNWSIGGSTTTNERDQYDDRLTFDTMVNDNLALIRPGVEMSIQDYNGDIHKAISNGFGSVCPPPECAFTIIINENMEKNIIKNPGFELYDANGLTDWTCDIVGVTAPDLPVCPIRDTLQKHSGSASVYINTPGIVDASTGHIQQWVDVLPNTEYVFSAWFKTEDYGSNISTDNKSAINLIEVDFNYQSIGFYHPEHIRYYSNTRSIIGSTYDWTYADGLIRAETNVQSNSFITSPWTYHIKVFFGTWKSYGKIWIDDLDLHATQPNIS